MFFAIWPSWLDAILISKKAFINSIFNGVTLAGLYFLVASGFTLVFGLMRNVNLAHGSLYLLGAYIGYEVAQRTGIWLLGVGAGTVAMAVVGLLMQVFIFRRLEGDELRQTLVTLGISIVAADLMLAIWTGITYQIGIPSWLDGAVKLPIITTVRSNGTAVMMTYPFYRLVVLAVAIVIGVGLWLMINRTRIGMMIRPASTIVRCFRPPASMCTWFSPWSLRSALGWPALPAWSAVPRSKRSWRGRPLPARVSRGCHRRRHGLNYRCRHRRPAGRPRRADRTSLFADLRHRFDLHYYGGDAGVPPPRHHGESSALQRSDLRP